jgi:SPOR domain
MSSDLKPRITKEVITRFYVEIGDWIQAGPFDTREEAQAALNAIRAQEVTK